MQKLLAFIEGYVEWVAVGLAGIYVLLMVYWYVLTPPATVKIGGKDLSPSEVDPAIVSGSVAQLDDAMNRDSAAVVMHVPDYADQIEAAIADSNAHPANLNGTWITFAPEPIEDITPGGNNPNAPKPGNAQLAEPLPAPGELVVENGRSTVQLPLPPANGDNGPPQQPPAAQAGNGAAAGGGGTADRDWVTVFTKIDVAKIADAFKTAAIPDVIPPLTTSFLRVELARQEQIGVDATGTPAYSTEVPVDPIATVNLQAFPANNAPPAANFEYAIWSETHQADILQPPFYTVTAGDQWSATGKVNGGVMPAVPPVAPAQNPQQQPPRRPPARRPQQTPHYPTPGTGGGRGRGSRGGGGSFAPDDQDRPTTPYGMPPGGIPLGGYPGAYPGGFPGGRGYPGNRNAGNANNPGGVPVQAFVPSQVQPTVLDVWAHDDTAAAGKTYRYKMRYVMKNPVYKTNQGPQNVVNQFTLASDWSDWTAPVAIPARTSFYIVNTPAPGSDRVTFAVFRWAEGKLNSANVTVTPGDEIGTTTKGGLEFNSHNILADVLPDGNVLVLDEADGQLHRRTFQDDSTSGEYRKLDTAMKSIDAAGAGAAGQPGGAPPGLGGPPGGSFGQTPQQ